MSNRAYKIIKIETEKSPTFNLWHDEFIMSRLDNSQLNDDLVGVWCIEKSDIQNLLDEAIKADKSEFGNYEDKKECIKTIKQMLKDCGKSDYVEYMCF